MRTFISMRFLSLVTQNAKTAISVEELQASYNELVDAIIVESFAETEFGVRYNALSYTLIELRSLQGELKSLNEAGEKCANCNSFIQSN